MVIEVVVVVDGLYKLNQSGIVLTRPMISQMDTGSLWYSSI